MIHWGLNRLAAGEWEGQRQLMGHCSISKIPVDEYQTLKDIMSKTTMVSKPYSIYVIFFPFLSLLFKPLLLDKYPNL